MGILILVGCASKPDVSQSLSVNTLNELPSNWHVKGKIAVITPDERKSGYLSWHQIDSQFDMLLSTVVGSTIAKMQYDGREANIEVDDQKWQDSSPDFLIQQVTGWAIPVSSLPVWLAGQYQPKDATSFYPNGLLETLTPSCVGCEVWQISYKKYADFKVKSQMQKTLPSLINLEHQANGTRLIIRIDDWTFIQ